jgi:hypothetical protein
MKKSEMGRRGAEIQSPQEETMMSKIASGMIKQDTLAEIFNESLEFLVFFESVKFFV